MTAFKMFDPYAFRAAAEAGERRSGHQSTFAAFADLAAPGRLIDRSDHLALLHGAGDRTGGLAALAGLAAKTGVGDFPDDPDRTLAGPPAKAAQAAKSGVAIDASLLQVCAEGIAFVDAERPPRDVPARRWRQLIFDAARFLDGEFAAHAVALGWDALDLFGCDRDRPFARIDAAGLLWLLDGHRVVVLTTDSARIETRTGSTQTYRRKSGATGRVLAWQLEN